MRVTASTIALSSLLLSGQVLALSPAGKTMIAKGNVQAYEEINNARKLKRRAPIYGVDTVETANRSKAQFRMNDGTLLALKENSKLLISEYQYNQEEGGGSAVLELVEGGLRSVTGAIKSNNGSYELKTPVGSIGIRGTHFEVEIVEGDIFLAVWDGAIDLTVQTGPGVNSVVSFGEGEDFSFGIVTEEGEVTQLLEPPDNFNEGHSDDQNEEESSEENNNEEESNSDDNAEDGNEEEASSEESGTEESDSEESDSEESDSEEGGSEESGSEESDSEESDSEEGGSEESGSEEDSSSESGASGEDSSESDSSSESGENSESGNSESSSGDGSGSGDSENSGSEQGGSSNSETGGTGGNEGSGDTAGAADSGTTTAPGADSTDPGTGDTGAPPADTGGIGDSDTTPPDLDTPPPAEDPNIGDVEDPFDEANEEQRDNQIIQEINNNTRALPEVIAARTGTASFTRLLNSSLDGTNNPSNLNINMSVNFDTAFTEGDMNIAAGNGQWQAFFQGVLIEADFELDFTRVTFGIENQPNSVLVGSGSWGETFLANEADVINGRFSLSQGNNSVSGRFELGENP